LVGNNITVRNSIEVIGNRTFSEPSSVIPSSSTSAVRVGSFDLKTDYAAARVEEVTLVNVAGSFTGTNVTSGTARDMSSDGLLVTLRRGGQVVGNAQLLNGAAYIKLATPVEVAAGQSVVFEVEVSGATNIVSVAETNKTLRLGVLETNNLIDGTRQTLISSVGNSVDVTSILNNVLFNRHVVRATNIVFVDQATSAEWVAATDRVIYATNVSADSSRGANIKRLVFDHTIRGAAVSNYRVRLDSTLVDPSDVIITTGTNSLSVTFTGQYLNGFRIGAGGSRRIELVADLASPLQNSSLVTTLRRNTNTDFSMFAASSYAGPATVVWSDNASSNLTVDTVNWFTDAGVDAKATTNSWTFTYRD